MDGNVVFLGRTGEGVSDKIKKALVKHVPRESERVPLEVRDFGARQENVLPSACGCLLLLDLELHDVGRMLDNFGDVGDMTRANFTQDALVNPNNTTNKPVPLPSRISRRSNSKILTHTQNTPMVLDEQ